jgi:hypothetical protein
VDALRSLRSRRAQQAFLFPGKEVVALYPSLRAIGAPGGAGKTLTLSQKGMVVNY